MCAMMVTKNIKEMNGGPLYVCSIGVSKHFSFLPNLTEGSQSGLSF
jgi:hypothetical protein